MDKMPVKTQEELQELLSKPLPPEAIKDHPTKKGMSSINVIYVTERLNEVFGIGSWTVSVDQVPNTLPITTVNRTNARGQEITEYIALFKTVFQVPAYGIYYESIASNTNADMGDAAKGAKTDALTEIAGKFLGIGAHVWKGNPYPTATLGQLKAAKAAKATTSVSTTMCEKCGTPMKHIPAGVSNKTGQPYDAFYACPACKHTQR